MAAMPPVLTADEAPGMVASIGRIDAWLAVAQPGDVFVYATRLCLPLRNAGAARMRALQERGLVTLTQRRSSENRAFFNYIARRTTVPTALTRPARRVLGASTARVDGDEVAAVDALMPVLERFARAGRPCPTNRQLAERAALPEPMIQPTLQAMVAAHLIRVVGVAAPTCRRVVILASGATTGLMAT